MPLEGFCLYCALLGLMQTTTSVVVLILSSCGNKLQDKAPVDLFRVRIGTLELHLCLREAQAPYFPLRQRRDADLTLSKGKAAVSVWSDVVLRLKEALDPFTGDRPDFPYFHAAHLA